MENMDHVDGIIFKTLGEHEYRINGQSDCINTVIEHLAKLKASYNNLKLSHLIGYFALGYAYFTLAHKVYQQSAEIEELKQVKGE